MSRVINQKQVFITMSSEFIHSEHSELFKKGIYLLKSRCQNCVSWLHTRLPKYQIRFPFLRKTRHFILRKVIELLVISWKWVDVEENSEPSDEGGGTFIPKSRIDVESRLGREEQREKCNEQSSLQRVCLALACSPCVHVHAYDEGTFISRQETSSLTTRIKRRSHVSGKKTGSVPGISSLFPLPLPRINLRRI